MGPPEAYGPPEAAGPTEAEGYGPVPVQTKPIVLVLGPGQAHALAYIGVLRALEEAKIPIAAIVATELGGWVGVLYGLTESVNQLDWSLLKFKSADLMPTKQIFSGLLREQPTEPNDGDAFENDLRETIGTKELKESRVPLYLVAYFPDEKQTQMVDSGAAVPLVRATSAFSLTMKPGMVEGKKAESAARERPFPISEAKRITGGPVVAIDVVGIRNPGKDPLEKKIASELRAAELSATADLSQADLVIRPLVDGYSYLDFDKKTEIIFRGKQAIRKEADKLLQMTGAGSPK